MIGFIHSKNKALLAGVAALALLLLIAGVLALNAGKVPEIEKDKQNEGGQSREHEDIHFHTAFQIYLDGKLQDFSALKFMNLKPCSQDDHEEDEIKDVTERIHLHNNIGDVAHIHDEGVIWRNLFESLHITDLIDEKNASYWVNGKPAENALDKEVAEYEWVVMAFGKKPTDKQISNNKITKAHIIDAETGVENCGK